MKRILVALATTLTLPVTAALASAPAASAADDATVSVVHGIPDTPVNVFVNGKPTLQDFKPGTVAGPLSLPAGSYKVTVFAASNMKGTGKPVLSATADVQAGQNVSLVAHLTAKGQPTITPYGNDTSPIKAGDARLVVRHTAAAPAVDVRANGKVAFSDLTNPKEASADLPAGAIKADVVLAGTKTVAIGPAPLDLMAGNETVVYAIGSAEQKNLSLVVQTIRGLGMPPSGVPAGGGANAVAADSGAPTWVWTSVALGVSLIVIGGFYAVRLVRVQR